MTNIFNLSVLKIGLITLVFSLLLTFIVYDGQTQNSEWLTYYEKSNFLETPRYDETIEYCRRLANATPYLHYTNFGVSPQGRALPLLIADRNKNFDPGSVRNSNNAVLMIMACIHPGESEGKDAGLMLMRDIIFKKKLSNLLDHVTILFIPIFNVDGHERFGPYNRINQNGPKEMGWRVTAQNLNLNRDFLKADAPEMKAWLKLFNQWLPDFFIDCHTTDGADYQYVLTYALEIHGNMYPGLTKWQTDVYIPEMKTKMQNSGFPIFPYVTFRNWHDPESGLRTWIAPPRLSEGYTAIQNRPGLLIETHMLKEYKPRVSSTFEMLKYTLELLNKEYLTLRQLIKEADDFTASSEFRKQEFPLNYKGAKDSIMVEFMGVEYSSEKSDLTGGKWFKYSDKPTTFNLPFFNKMEPDLLIQLPEAYIIPPEWTEVIDRIKLHGIQFNRLKEETSISVKSYKFKNAKWNPKPYEGRHPLSFDYEEIEEVRQYPLGSVVIDMNQRTARVIAHILEPKAPDSYLYWGFFSTIFEQKEYTESYVMEAMAREMLFKDPELEKEFEAKKQNDPEFANNPRAILNWFYSKTPYWDEKLNVYPVGKIYDRGVLEKLDF